MTDEAQNKVCFRNLKKEAPERRGRREKKLQFFKLKVHSFTSWLFFHLGSISLATPHSPPEPRPFNPVAIMLFLVQYLECSQVYDIFCPVLHDQFWTEKCHKFSYYW